jgi:EAL domain-containing protein (putative c-di-GMP-specific phosphodiesterase class I)
MSVKTEKKPVEGLWAPRTSGIEVRESNVETLPGADKAPEIPAAPKPPADAVFIQKESISDLAVDALESDQQTDMVGCIPVDDLSCVYQPIVDLRNGRAFAYEVLARCKTPGLTNPEVLFKRAASERFCGILGRTLRTIGSRGCRGIPLFLNVHPAELAEKYVIQLDDPMYRHDDDVFVEVTESVPFSHYDLCNHMLREMRDRGGVHVVIDDLGAGYSNLKRIADLRPAVVKLDRLLVKDLDQHDRQRILVRAVVRMCIDLNSRVVAEGLETWGEIAAVRDCGCHYGQGYALGRPKPTPEMPEWRL